ncbi:hypothetical protein FRC08_002547 [Ceratobasidium sp. 394]|nr:hypothetical protein FRC08_002547 [Ceratobasidium sp. 394]
MSLIKKLVPQFSNHHPLLQYARSGASKPKAQKSSMDALRNVPGMRTRLIRWDFDPEGLGFRATPHVYGEPVPLYDPAVIGYGGSRNAAIEDSARKLLLGRYCLF